MSSDLDASLVPIRFIQAIYNVPESAVGFIAVDVSPQPS